MNKIISIISAAVLGITFMLLPVLLFTPTFQYSQPETSLIDLNERITAIQTSGKSDIGAVAFPSSVIHAVIIGILGLVIALSTSLYIKKK